MSIKNNGTAIRHFKWCIYGSGRAGQARMQSLSLELGATGTLYSARTNELNTLLSKKRFDGVVICTENQRHATDIQCALSHGCHVIVEFPLAMSADTARELYAMAEERQLMLHCEHIGLLKPSIQWLLKTRPALRSIRVDFQGGLYRWLTESYQRKTIAPLIVGRLQVLWALCGPLSVKQLSYVDEGDGFLLDIQFESSTVESVELSEKRHPDLKRQSNWQFYSDLGNPLKFPSFKPTQLFYEDWCAAMAILSGCETYLKNSDVIAVLALCDHIQDSL